MQRVAEIDGGGGWAKGEGERKVGSRLRLVGCTLCHWCMEVVEPKLSGRREIGYGLRNRLVISRPYVVVRTCMPYPWSRIQRYDDT